MVNYYFFNIQKKRKLNFILFIFSFISSISGKQRKSFLSLPVIHDPLPPHSIPHYQVLCLTSRSSSASAARFFTCVACLLIANCSDALESCKSGSAHVLFVVLKNSVGSGCLIFSSEYFRFDFFFLGAFCFFLPLYVCCLCSGFGVCN